MNTVGTKSSIPRNFSSFPFGLQSIRSTSMEMTQTLTKILKLCTERVPLELHKPFDEY